MKNNESYSNVLLNQRIIAPVEWSPELKRHIQPGITNWDPHTENTSDDYDPTNYLRIPPPICEMIRSGPNYVDPTLDAMIQKDPTVSQIRGSFCLRYPMGDRDTTWQYVVSQEVWLTTNLYSPATNPADPDMPGRLIARIFEDKNTISEKPLVALANHWIRKRMLDLDSLIQQLQFEQGNCESLFLSCIDRNIDIPDLPKYTHP